MSVLQSTIGVHFFIHETLALPPRHFNLDIASHGHHYRKHRSFHWLRHGASLFTEDQDSPRALHAR